MGIVRAKIDSNAQGPPLHPTRQGVALHPMRPRLRRPPQAAHDHVCRIRGLERPLPRGAADRSRVASALSRMTRTSSGSFRFASDKRRRYGQRDTPRARIEFFGVSWSLFSYKKTKKPVVGQTLLPFDQACLALYFSRQPCRLKILSTLPRRTRRPRSRARVSLQRRAMTKSLARTQASIRRYMRNFGRANSSLYMSL